MSRRLVTVNHSLLTKNGWSLAALLAEREAIDTKQLPGRSTLRKLFNDQPVSEESVGLVAAHTKLDPKQLEQRATDDDLTSLVKAIRNTGHTLERSSLSLERELARKILENSDEALKRLAADDGALLSENGYFGLVCEEFFQSAMPQGTTYYAVCGRKSWGHPSVTRYFEENLRIVGQLCSDEQNNPQLSRRTRLTRIFIEGKGETEAEKEERQKVMDRHMEEARHGVKALWIPEEGHVDIEFSGLRKLFSDGFGFLLVKTEGKHVSINHAPYRSRLMVRTFRLPYIVDQMQYLFTSLQRIAEPTIDRRALGRTGTGS